VSTSVLIVDDEATIGALLVRSLGREGFVAESETNPEAALERLKEHPFDVLITDLRMPRIDGLEVLRRAHAVRPGCEVVLITGHATVDTAREALKRGAVDYITKPFSISKELIPVVRQIAAAGGHDAKEALPGHRARTLARQEPPAPELVGQGQVLRGVFDRARKVAATNSSVLLTGESGSGKEVIANLIHRLSPRHDRPMIRINCAALPETLLESELFGYRKGAFTGANRDHDGVFQAAHGGTIFLDEIGEISPAFQPKLLRVLQEGEFYRIGVARRSIVVDVRVIASTNRDLGKAVRSGAFREDLYYRLNVVPIEAPPLREHMEDLHDLIDHFARRLGSGREPRISSDALAAMRRYPWPGNVRELANAIEHAIVLGDGPEIRLEDLPAAIQDHERIRQLGALRATPKSDSSAETLEEIEMSCILQALDKTSYNRTQAARLLGITRRRLGYRIAKYRLEDPLEAGRRSAARRHGAAPLRSDGTSGPTGGSGWR
jgi:DNA-binding NtrC family response regulator